MKMYCNLFLRSLVLCSIFCIYIILLYLSSKNCMFISKKKSYKKKKKKGMVCFLDNEIWTKNKDVWFALQSWWIKMSWIFFVDMESFQWNSYTYSSNRISISTSVYDKYSRILKKYAKTKSYSLKNQRFLVCGKFKLLYFQSHAFWHNLCNRVNINTTNAMC